MKKFVLFFVSILALAFIIADTAPAATIQWSAVQNTDTCIIAGYTVHFAETTSPDKWFTYPTTDLQVQDIEKTFNLIPGKEYLFSVNAYSTENVQGPKTEPITWAYVPPAPEANLPPTVIYIPGRVEQIIFAK